MPAERFYFDGELEGTIQLSGQEHHHLAHVMRIRAGEEVELVNGRSSFATARVEHVSKNGATLKILDTTSAPLPAPGLILAIPLMRLAKLELVVEKCTELGAHGFLIYTAHFSEKDALSLHQLQRLRHIAISAMKQCGRLDLPAIQKTGFEDVLQVEGMLLFGDPDTKNRAEESKGGVIFVTGPEKGFSEKEVEALKKRGRGIRLHRNTLRAETAPIAAAVLMTTSSTGFEPVA